MDNSVDSNDSSLSFVESAHLAQELIHRAIELRASALVIEEHSERSIVRFERAASDTELALSEPQTFPKIYFTTLREYFASTAGMWAGAHEPVFLINSSQTKRILLAPLAQDTQAISAEFVIRKAAPPAQKLFALEQIQEVKNPEILDSLDFSAFTKNVIRQGLSVDTGIVLCDCSATQFDVDAKAMVSALRPDALYLPLTSIASNPQALLELAATNLVIVGVPGLDPLQMLYEVAGCCRVAASSPRDLLGQTRFSLVHRRIKRSCAACSRSTTIDSMTLERIPASIRPAKNTYMFGRGCDVCGHSAYYGTVGIDSIISVDRTIAELILKDSDSVTSAQAVYAAGTRTLLEDGMDKIFSGLTSFEQVFSVTDKLPTAFAAVLNRRLSGSTLPPAAAEKESNPQLVFRPETSSKAPSSKKLSLLIVEDDNDQRGILEIVFKNEGYEVLGAESGSEALKILTEMTPDLIICDLMMPGISGEQLVQKVREIPVLRDIPIMVLTAIASPDVEYNLLSKGADDYCEKHVKRKILVKRVEKLLERRGANPIGHLLRD